MTRLSPFNSYLFSYIYVFGGRNFKEEWKNWEENRNKDRNIVTILAAQGSIPELLISFHQRHEDQKRLKDKFVSEATLGNSLDLR